MMTYEEAKMQIQAIPEKIWDQLSEPDREAMEMAFSALQAQEAKTQLSREDTTFDLISRQTAIDAVFESAVGRQMLRGHRCLIEILKHLPSAQPEIVRCKECKYRGGLSGFYCDIVEKAVGVDSFCSWAERRTDDLQ